MKTFRYALGHECCETMTVGELRGKLAVYPDDMPVFATWETVDTPFHPDSFRVEHLHRGHPDDECECLVIDVDQK